MSKFDDLIQQARDAGVDESWLEQLQDASPLRKDNRELEEKLGKAIEREGKYRGAALRGQFNRLGIKIKPDALNIPGELDATDDDAVQAWAVDMGLAEPPPPTVPPTEVDAHRKIDEATRGTTPPTPPDARDEILSSTNEEEFWAKARAAGMVSD